MNPWGAWACLDHEGRGGWRSTCDECVSIERWRARGVGPASRLNRRENRTPDEAARAERLVREFAAALTDDAIEREVAISILADRCARRAVYGDEI